MRPNLTYPSCRNYVAKFCSAHKTPSLLYSPDCVALSSLCRSLLTVPLSPHYVALSSLYRSLLTVPLSPHCAALSSMCRSPHCVEYWRTNESDYFRQKNQVLIVDDKDLPLCHSLLTVPLSPHCAALSSLTVPLSSHCAAHCAALSSLCRSPHCTALDPHCAALSSLCRSLLTVPLSPHCAALSSLCRSLLIVPLSPQCAALLTVSNTGEQTRVTIFDRRTKYL